MKLLLDTHIFFWMLTDPDRLSARVQDALRDPENRIFFSAVVSWEIASKRAAGKLTFDNSPVAVARKLGLEEMSILSEHCEAAGELAPHHKDPFDRLLVAQAQVENLVLVTGDTRLLQYQVATLKN